jgi:hypothetical protein
LVTCNILLQNSILSLFFVFQHRYVWFSSSCTLATRFRYSFKLHQWIFASPHSITNCKKHFEKQNRTSSFRVDRMPLACCAAISSWNLDFWLQNFLYRQNSLYRFDVQWCCTLNMKGLFIEAQRLKFCGLSKQPLKTPSAQAISKQKVTKNLGNTWKILSANVALMVRA